MELMHNTLFLLFLTLLLILTVYPHTWIKIMLSFIAKTYGFFLWYTSQYLFLFILFIIETFLFYNLLKSVFHSV